MSMTRFTRGRFFFLLVTLSILCATMGRSNLPVSAALGGAPALPNHESSLSGAEITPPVYLPLVVNNYFSLQPSVFGIDFISINPSNGTLEMRRAGSYWTRRTKVAWSLVETSQGARDWSGLGSLPDELTTAQGYGFSPILVIQSTPSWAQALPGYSCGRLKADAIPAFAEFIYDLVIRYSVHPYNVKYWEIWNEPDVSPTVVSAPDSGFGCWGDENDPYYGGGYYTDVLKAVYPRIKAADPAAQVIVGGLLLDCNPTLPGACPPFDPANGKHGDRPAKYLEGILRHNGANDGGQYFDGISFHAYDYYRINLGQGYYTNYGWLTTEEDGPVMVAKVDYINNVLAAYGVQGKFLMNTEVALICGDFYAPPGGPGCEATDTSPFEITKAYYLAQSFVVGQAMGLKGIIWYYVFGWRNSGLLNRDRTPRPAYRAFATAHHALSDAVFLRKITQFPGVEGDEFDRGNGRILWVLWSKDAAISHPVTLGRIPTVMYDAVGVTLPLSISFNVSQKPVYIEWLR